VNIGKLRKKVISNCHNMDNKIAFVEKIKNIKMIRIGTHHTAYVVITKDFKNIVSKPVTVNHKGLFISLILLVGLLRLIDVTEDIKT